MPKFCKISLFSGGSGSVYLARALEGTGSEITNILAVFDNGGSTGRLRQVFGCPAMGDIRKRLVDLAPAETRGQRAMKALFDLRLSDRKSQNQLHVELGTLARGSHPSFQYIPDAARLELIGAIDAAASKLPPDFSLRELSLGNLLLVGKSILLADFSTAVQWARKILCVKSHVLPVTTDSVHLGALLENQSWILGQADLTTESFALPALVSRLAFLEQDDSYAFLANANATSTVLASLQTADAVVFGFGSFLTSILPNLLVKGVGSALTHIRAAKVFICNPTTDKETRMLTVAQITKMVENAALGDSSPGSEPVLTHVLHFGSDTEMRIPRGDMSAFRGEYIDCTEIPDFTSMATKSCEVLTRIATKTEPIAAVRNEPAMGVHRIALFDLDGTLFDYTGLRLKATAAALDGLVDKPNVMSERLLDLLRPPLTDVLNSLGFPDLRREWDSPEVLKLAIALNRHDELLAPVITAMSELIGQEESATWSYRFKCAKCAATLRRSGALALLNAIAAVGSEADAFIREGQMSFRAFVQAHASLAAGAEQLFSQLIERGIEVHVVSEGDSSVQMFKLQSLGLVELVKSSIITDITLGANRVLDELFTQSLDLDDQSAVELLYNELAAFTVKSPSFYTKLLHVLAEDDSELAIKERVKTPRFLTVDEWQSTKPISLVMVGDRYRKDLEPLLTVCSAGCRVYRIATGRYYREDPLHELMDQRRLLPHGVFTDMRDLELLVAATLEQPDDTVKRPIPILPQQSSIDAVLHLPICWSEITKSALLALKAEISRHRGTES